jgi:hypothetical protein
MGDRTYTQIEFAGVISEEQAEELVELLNAQGCEVNECDQNDLMTALKNGSSFYDSECNYAQMEDIESWCGENDVAYLKTWEAGGGYGPGIELWKPGMKEALQCESCESSPVAALEDLKKAHAAGKVGELIESLERFSGLDGELQVLAVEDWTPELCVFMAKRKLEAA